MTIENLISSADAAGVLSIVYAALWIALAAIFMAVQETLEAPEKFNRSIFKNLKRDWWLKTESWVRKYKRKDGILQVNGWDASGAVKYKARFPGSVTWLVFLTDAWHLFKFMTWTSVAVAILTAAGSDWSSWLTWGSLFALKSITGSCFEWFYSSVLKSRS